LMLYCALYARISSLNKEKILFGVSLSGVFEIVLYRVLYVGSFINPT
jgi:hypothetical protein